MMLKKIENATVFLCHKMALLHDDLRLRNGGSNRFVRQDLSSVDVNLVLESIKQSLLEFVAKKKTWEGDLSSNGQTSKQLRTNF